MVRSLKYNLKEKLRLYDLNEDRKYKKEQKIKKMKQIENQQLEIRQEKQNEIYQNTLKRMYQDLSLDKIQELKDEADMTELASEVAEHLPHNIIHITNEEYLKNKDTDFNYYYYNNKYYYTDVKYISFIYKTPILTPTYFTPIINNI